MGSGPFAVRAEADDPSLLAALTGVFAGAPVPPAPQRRYTFTLRREGDRFRLTHPAGEKVLDHPEYAAAVVQGVMLEALAAGAPAHLRLHAAALAGPDGRVLLLPAESGTGKSTASLALALEGWRVLTDDLAYWDLESGQAHGGDFAIALKAQAPEGLGLPAPSVREGRLRYRDEDGVDAEQWTYATTPQELPWIGAVGAVVFLRRSDGEPASRLLTPGEAVPRLWQARLQARPHDPPHEPAAVARALAGVTLAEVATSRVEDVAAAILRALGT